MALVCGQRTSGGAPALPFRKAAGAQLLTVLASLPFDVFNTCSSLFKERPDRLILLLKRKPLRPRALDPGSQGTGSMFGLKQGATATPQPGPAAAPGLCL